MGGLTRLSWVSPLGFRLALLTLCIISQLAGEVNTLFHIFSKKFQRQKGTNLVHISARYPPHKKKGVSALLIPASRS